MKNFVWDISDINIEDIHWDFNWDNFLGISPGDINIGDINIGEIILG